MTAYIDRAEYCGARMDGGDNAVVSDFEAIPAADVAPVVHGQWIDNGANGYKWAFVCSRCGYVDGHPFDDRHNFCPNCGARMDDTDGE